MLILIKLKIDFNLVYIQIFLWKKFWLAQPLMRTGFKTFLTKTKDGAIWQNQIIEWISMNMWKYSESLLKLSAIVAIVAIVVIIIVFLKTIYATSVLIDRLIIWNWSFFSKLTKLFTSQSTIFSIYSNFQLQYFQINCKFHL